MSDKTTIEISKKPTRGCLKIYKAEYALTYDQAINELSDMAEETTDTEK